MNATKTLLILALALFSLNALGNSPNPIWWVGYCRGENLKEGDICVDRGEEQGICVLDEGCLERAIEAAEGWGYDPEEEGYCLICECPNCEPAEYRGIFGCQSISITTNLGFLILAIFLFFTRRRTKMD